MKGREFSTRILPTHDTKPQNVAAVGRKERKGLNRPKEATTRRSCGGGEIDNESFLREGEERPSLYISGGEGSEMTSRPRGVDNLVTLGKKEGGDDTQGKRI